ncbi:MFS transporter [Streptomyces sedi]|uniref:MFS transporter n=1 Tax=Streptomyces sedi TaxID=555059 RepID=A0A5C4VF67_9ACTN|nr:MFS transporter [Streptomyces sedi]TNM34564.1 MFS transporter [Streptomyces sedi]
MKPTETAARGADPEEPAGEGTTSERGGPGGPTAPAPDGPADPPAEPAGGVLSAPYRALTLGCVATVLLIAFEAMAVGTAMPAAADALDGVSLYAFAFSAFFTTSLLGMSVSGQWCDRSGPLAPVLAGIGTFALGLLLSGVAQSMWVFVAGRALQGAGGGLVIVALYVTVRLAFPERLRPAALAAFSASWVVPSMVGPVIAGTITEQLGWRWVFLGITVLVVLPLVALVPALRRAASGPPEGASRTLDRRRLKLAGAVAVGAGLLQYGGQELRWVSLLPVAVGLALLAPSAARLLPAGTFRLRRGLPSVIALRGVMSAAYLSTQTFLPLLLVTQRDLSYTQAGLSLAASGATWAAGSWTQSRAWAEPHRFRLVRGGTVAVTVGVGTTPLVLLDAAPVWLPVLTLAVGAFGMGLVVSTVGVLVLRFSTPKEAGGNVASLQLCDSLANVVMLTSVGSLFAALGGDATAAAGHASESSTTVDTAVGPGAFVAVYAAAFTMALLSIVVGGRLREHEPAGAGFRGAT